MDAVGARFLDPPHDWLDWLATADVLQLNAVEYGSLCSCAGFPTEPFEAGCSELLSILRGHGKGRPWAIIRTSRERVAVGYRKDEQLRFEVRDIAPTPVRHCAYTIGCGDAFGAGVFSCLRRNWGPDGLVEGLAVGIRWAAEATAVLGVPQATGAAQ